MGDRHNLQDPWRGPYMASQYFVKGSTYDHRSRQIVTTYVGLFDKQKTYIRGDWGELEQFTLKLL